MLRDHLGNSELHEFDAVDPVPNWVFCVTPETSLKWIRFSNKSYVIKSESGVFIFTACPQNGHTIDILIAEGAMAARDLQIRGAPTAVINTNIHASNTAGIRVTEDK